MGISFEIFRNYLNLLGFFTHLQAVPAKRKSELHGRTLLKKRHWFTYYLKKFIRKIMYTWWNFRSVNRIISNVFVVNIRRPPIFIHKFKSKSKDETSVIPFFFFIHSSSPDSYINHIETVKRVLNTFIHQIKQRFISDLTKW